MQDASYLNLSFENRFFRETLQTFEASTGPVLCVVKWSWSVHDRRLLTPLPDEGWSYIYKLEIFDVAAWFTSRTCKIFSSVLWCSGRPLLTIVRTTRLTAIQDCWVSYITVTIGYYFHCWGIVVSCVSYVIAVYYADQICTSRIVKNLPGCCILSGNFMFNLGFLVGLWSPRMYISFRLEVHQTLKISDLAMFTLLRTTTQSYAFYNEYRELLYKFQIQ